MVMQTVRDQMQKVLDAGHPDSALVGMTVGALRQLLGSEPANGLTNLPAAPAVPA